MKERRQYFIFIALVILATLVTQAIIHYYIYLEKNDSTVINIAGRQRMLSQQIAKLSLQIQSSSNSEPLKDNLREVLYEWEEKHWGLVYRSPELRLRGSNSPKIESIFASIKSPYTTILNNARQIISTQDSNRINSSTAIILQNEGLFLKGMNEIVDQFDLEASKKTTRLQIIEVCVGIFTVMLIIVELFWLIKPMLRQLTAKKTELLRNNQELLSQQKFISLQNEQLRLEKEKAEAAAKTKSRFLSNMSHEIRTPMNAVMGMIYILLQDKPRPEQKEQLKTIQFSANNLMVIIDDILDFSKIEAGKLNIEVQAFDFNTMVLHIYKSMQPKAAAKNLLIQLNQSEKIPTYLLGDQTRLSQILFNLLNNAIKFTEEGRVELQIQTIKQSVVEIQLRFSIIDTGIGIPPEKIALIFDSFSQVDDGSTRIRGGTGLGLAITKQLLELLGSKIEVESKLGEGSTFSFNLTFPIPSQVSNQASSTRQFLKNARIPHLGKLLVVEDNLFNIKVLEKMLALWKIEMDLARNGAEALEKLKTNEYSLVLMDLQMPVMDGYEAVKIIRSWPDAKYQHLPIIALSASAMDEFRQRAFAVGMNDYVTKPLIPKDLFNAILRHVSPN